MHPITQTILAVGVLALVGMGGYVMLYGVPEYDRPLTQSERLDAALESAEETLCRSKLSRPASAYTDRGKAERLKCAIKYDF